MSLHNEWPLDRQEQLEEFFGPLPCVDLVNVKTPYPFRLAWDIDSTTSNLTVHRKVAASLVAVLNNISDAYNGDLEHLAAVGLDLLGGTYNHRKRSGAKNLWSLHSWGAAIDLNPLGNRLEWRYPGKASMPKIAVDIFSEHGWSHGGTLWGRDAMHFQATRPSSEPPKV